MKKKEIFRRLMVQVLFIIAAYGLISLLIMTGVIDQYVGKIMITATVYVIVALGINLITGMTGQLVLGQAGFLSIGGYAAAILLKAGFPMIPALLLGATFAALIGLLVALPLFTLRGDYLAIVTLAIGEIVVVVMNNLTSLTGGASGLMGIRNIAVSGPNATLIIFLWTSAFMVLALLAMVHLLTSSQGRAILSVREDEIASESMGINVYYMKIFAFVVAAFFAGLGGGLFATETGYLNPSQFNFIDSVNFMVIVVFGGLGSLTGTVLASYILVLVQETVLRNLPTIPIHVFGINYNLELESYRLVIYPLLLILMMIFRPQGLLGTKEFRLTRVISREGWQKAAARFRKGAKRNADS